MDIILKPIITEKATNDSEIRNRYTFVVNRGVNKIQIKNAVEEKYTTLKNSGAKFWVTHGRLRGLTFEHFQTKMSPGRG